MSNREHEKKKTDSTDELILLVAVSESLPPSERLEAGMGDEGETTVRSDEAQIGELRG